MTTPFLPLTHDAPTIVAQATASGPAGVAILRLSGSQAWGVAQKLFHGSPLRKGRIAYGTIQAPHTQEVIDDVIVLAFQAPHSFTGEDVIEIQCHGGQVIPQRILQLCLAAGAELAPKGEFSRRAFLNGKLNLTQAEAIVDAIHAEGEALAKVAVQSLYHNALGKRLLRLRDVLIDIQADVVAAMDYPEEVDEPDTQGVFEKLSALIEEANAYTVQSKRYTLMREGLKIALLGQPNAGKSSLFNALLTQERSIVTEQAGTTRDVVSERLLVGGVPITLVDTAGLRETEDVIERMGVERSLQTAQQADALLYLVDVETLDSPAYPLPSEDERILAQLPPETPLLKIFNKVDRCRPEAKTERQSVHPDWHLDWVWVSAKHHVGIEAVLSWLEAQIQAGLGNPTTEEASICLNERQLDCLRGMTQHLQEAQRTVQTSGIPLDMLSIPLTDALRELDSLLGIDTAESVLDEVFSRFCVGK